jgi:hypothetical protein
LAQANLTQPLAPLDAQVMGQFVMALDAVNRIAEHSLGFVWRLRSSESHGATMLRDSSHQLLVNLSVWESYEALHALVYRSPHGGIRAPPCPLVRAGPTAVHSAVVDRGGAAAHRR